MKPLIQILCCGAFAWLVSGCAQKSLPVEQPDALITAENGAEVAAQGSELLVFLLHESIDLLRMSGYEGQYWPPSSAAGYIQQKLVWNTLRDASRSPHNLARNACEAGGTLAVVLTDDWHTRHLHFNQCQYNQAQTLSTINGNLTLRAGHQAPELIADLKMEHHFGDTTEKIHIQGHFTYSEIPQEPRIISQLNLDRHYTELKQNKIVTQTDTRVRNGHFHIDATFRYFDFAGEVAEMSLAKGVRSPLWGQASLTARRVTIRDRLPCFLPSEGIATLNNQLQSVHEGQQMHITLEGKPLDGSPFDGCELLQEHL